MTRLCLAIFESCLISSSMNIMFLPMRQKWSMITGVSGFFVHMRSTSGRSAGVIRKLSARLCFAPAANIFS